MPVAASMTSSRLLTLLSLLQARRDWPGGELAERLEVSWRTIRRDVERLRGLGYPVESLTGPAGGYRLAAGTAMPPLLLDDDEAIAIAVGLRTAARASVTGIEETAVRALVKLEQVLPGHLRRRVQALGAATTALPAPGPTVDPQCLTVLATACRDHECVRFAYEARDGTAGRRDVEPLADVVQRARADPADVLLHRQQGRQQQVALGPRGVPADREAAVDAGADATLPARRRRAEHVVDRGALGLGGLGVEQVEVHSVALDQDLLGDGLRDILDPRLGPHVGDVPTKQ